MPQGVEHVEAALELVQGAPSKIGEMAGVDEAWRASALAKLSGAEALLRATMERFFLKTRASVPFARKVQEQAEGLAAALPEPAADAQVRLEAAGEGLERAAQVLDERSMMPGFTVT